MKYRPFIYTLLSFIFVSNLFYTPQSQAKPSPIFEPIIKDIKTRLPSRLKMRLPAIVPTTPQNFTLYSFLRDDDSKLVIDLDDLKMEFFTVIIAKTPDCSEQKNPEDCLVAAVGVTKDPIKSEAELNALIADNEEDATSAEFERGIEVGQEIEGFYLAEADFQLIIWRQEQMTYLLITKKCINDCISKKELINMAKSTANEPAIINSDTSYYSF